MPQTSRALITGLSKYSRCSAPAARARSFLSPSPLANGWADPQPFPGAGTSLLRLGQVTTRANPGTDTETLGLFHETLVHHLRSETVWSDLVKKAHEAVLAELDVITEPAAQTYRRARAAEHLWALERYDQALEAVVSGLDHRANDNRNILESWDPRSEGSLQRVRAD